MSKKIIAVVVLAFLTGCAGMEHSSKPAAAPNALPRMYFADESYGAPFAKDPEVIRFRGAYYLYYSLKYEKGKFIIGIARSTNLNIWEKMGEIRPETAYEKKGIAAPGAIVLDGCVHLFYQTYGNGPKDAICHAVSKDAVHFTRDDTNPIFSPTGAWNCGRAIDAAVFPYQDRLLLFFATRDPSMTTQMLGMASAPLASQFHREDWTQCGEGPILKPELPWEGQCIEAPTLCRRKDRLYLFYAGNYNNAPQQIGVAASEDGIVWKRVSNLPLLPNGPAGSWNASESGHPGVFVDRNGSHHLFFQGNNDHGKTWHLSRMEIRWEKGIPYLMRPEDGYEFHPQR
ncbi:MAG TPA: family 43 glycosylhydrolase [Candidatus Hydrogenedentes bacterium]|nr:family 43 glycosylhydrolase [Candidatus Hydrogenedentota bacterium]